MSERAEIGAAYRIRSKDCISELMSKNRFISTESLRHPISSKLAENVLDRANLRFDLRFERSRFKRVSNFYSHFYRFEPTNDVPGHRMHAESCHWISSETITMNSFDRGFFTSFLFSKVIQCNLKSKKLQFRWTPTCQSGLRSMNLKMKLLIGSSWHRLNRVRTPSGHRGKISIKRTMENGCGGH